MMNTAKTQDVSPHTFLTSTQKAIEEIIGQGSASDNKNLVVFIQQFYAHTPVEDLADLSYVDWYGAAKSLLQFIAERIPGEPKIRIISPTVEKNGWHSAHTIVEMVNDDMPFLVDSVSAELNRQGVKLYQIIHPVLHVRRDSEGNLQQISDAAEEGAIKESVIHFQITHIPEEKAGKIEAALYDILKLVRCSVGAWREIVGIVQEVSGRLPKDANRKEQVEEIHQFVDWLVRDHFTFLGSVSRDIHKGAAPTVNVGTVKGVLALNNELLDAIATDANQAKTGDELGLIEIGKINKISKIHRPVALDYIAIRTVDASGIVTGETVVVGLFTSSVYYQSATLIPIIAKKIEQVIKRSGFSPVSHSGKELVTILESYPRDELFQVTEEELLETAMGIFALLVRPRVGLFVRQDKANRFISCLIYIPRERFSVQLSDKIQEALVNSFKGEVTSHYMQITDIRFARLHVILKQNENSVTDIDLQALEKRLDLVTSLWIDGFRASSVRELGESEGDKLFQIYRNAFPAAYRDRFSAEHIAYQDVREIEEALKSGKTGFDIYVASEDQPGVFQVKIYSPDHQIKLSEIMPILENMGFDVIDEHTFLISREDTQLANQSVWIHHFRVTVPGFTVIPSLDTVKRDAEEALSQIWWKEMQDDGFNRLIIQAGLSGRQVTLLRAFTKYVRQTGFTYSQAFVEEALGRYPQLAKQIVEVFYARFNPEIAEDSREAQIAECVKQIEDGLANVATNADDRVIRRLADIGKSVLRSNFFQLDAEGRHKSYISFKINSAKVPELPLPHPYAEIFVYSPRVEGIHLRGGKVARGGLRWSDRSEDFRTEVLGLMKAQMAKNAVIVPVGSKGGFVVKMPPAPELGRDAYLKEGIECYKTFLRGLLDVTDNIIDGAIVPPKQVVRHDGDDPYLVVAADKGTATFSDIANGISQEYNFWLGDAFASGGSVGYDHKKMGITARGAWISVERHFREMGIDTQRTDFTVVGIGDMSGDVFGNGMLLSEHIQLVGAFNHLHIFVDPNPDAAASFAERKRMFDLPRSSWKDYNTALISKGGAIFERSAKTLTLSAEIKVRFGITQDSLTPDELIRAMLLAPVDLLWNGGIGTYIKACEENHAMVGDKANDSVRVNGAELRCKVIGEGGNLGCTQRGRIEYAKNGGRVNTDAIDNSAGVDCSDHEVNIKIALGKAVEGGKLTLEGRNVLLEQMTDEVGGLVLRDNFLQTQALTIAQLQGAPLLETQARLIQLLEQEGILDRKIEFLPDEAEIGRRLANKEGMTRPELAILLAYSKLSIYNNLLQSNLPDDPYFLNDLVLYFPNRMREQFSEEIANHQLRREIIATFVTNSMVNRVGSTFFHVALEDTGLNGCDIARAYTITRDAFNLRALWSKIEELSNVVSPNIQMVLFQEVQSLVTRCAFWFLRNSSQPLNVSAIIADYAEGINTLASCLEEVLAGTAKVQYEQRLDFYKSEQLPLEFAKQMAGLSALSSACDIVFVAKKSGLPIATVAKIYFELGTRFKLGWLRSATGSINAESYWQRLSLNTLKDDLFDQQRRLTEDVVKHLQEGAESSEAWYSANNKQILRFDSFIQDLQRYEHLDFSMLVIAAKRVECLFAV